MKFLMWKHQWEKNLSKKWILDLNEQDPPNIQDLKSSKLWKSKNYNAKVSIVNFRTPDELSFRYLNGTSMTTFIFFN